MLLRFGVSNWASIRDSQELLFTASRPTDSGADLLPCAHSPSGYIVPAVALYGANASGKTNLFGAVRAMRSMVLYSHTKGDPDGGVPSQPFLLDPDIASKPSRFEIDFVLNDIRYHYGFESSSRVFETEWLYAFPKSHRRMLFERESGGYRFGRSLKGQNDIISKLTRENSLYLSAAAQNGHELLSKIYAYFRSVRLVGSISVPGTMASARLAEKDLDRRTIDFLDAIDTGVIDFRKKEIAVSDEVSEMNREILAVIRKSVGGNVDIDDSIVKEKMVEIELGHRGKTGSPVYFDLDRESAGTRRLLLVLDQVYRALDEGAPAFIDELDASLHTRAAEALIELFCTHDANRAGAQIIATTHDTNLMRSRSLRPDQLWFVEKDDSGATHIYPLTDIHIRKGDDIELGYLQGRFGAVPPRRSHRLEAERSESPAASGS